MKQKNKVGRTISILFIGVAAVIFGANQADAQTKLDQASVPFAEGVNGPSEGVATATVSLGDSKLISQEGSKFKVSFNIANGSGVQSGVRYGIELRSADGKTLVDSRVYDEVLFLEENNSLQREIDYAAPEYLKGNFQIWLVSKNEQALTFGLNVVGNVALDGTGKYINIDLPNCFLRISGDEKTYSLFQGVDVSSDEEVIMQCPATNTFETEMDVLPNIRTTFRSPFGRLISEQKGAAVRFGAGEKKEFSVVIPKADDPQAYDASLAFVDGQGKRFSNLAVAHYVLRGESATIQNVTLDKDLYAKGETALGSFFWSGRADIFPGARQTPGQNEKIFLKVSAVDVEGKKCAEISVKELGGQNQGGVENFSIPMTDDCRNGKMIVALTGENGRVLDEKVIEFRKAGEGPLSTDRSKDQPQDQEQKASFVPYLFAFGIFLVGVVAIIVAKKRRGVVGVLLLMFLGSLSVSESAKAGVSWSISAPAEGVYASFSAQLDRVAGDYCAGNNIVATGSGNFSACTNSSMNGINMSAMYSNGNTQYVFWNEGVSNSGSGSAVYDAPVAGSYAVFFRGRVFYWSGSRYVKLEADSPNIRFSVTDVTYASCGSANGVESATAPTANLCGSGETASAVTLSGSNWVWTCNSSVTCRLPKSCSAPYAAVAPVMSLSASPEIVVTGGSTNLTWSRIGGSPATSCESNFGATTESGGPLAVFPSATTEYWISCTNAGGTGFARVIVSLCPPPSCIIDGACVSQGSITYSCVPGVCAGGETCTSKANFCSTTAANNCPSVLVSPAVCVANGVTCEDATTCFCQNRNWIETSP